MNIFCLRKKHLLVAAVLTALAQTAHADTTWGLGVGSLYNGLGLNFGKTTDSSFTYGTLGCHSLSRGNNGTSKNETDTNCGVGIGYISTSLFANNKHGLGVGLDTTYNTFTSKYEARLKPGYYYFTNGINSSGFNFGIGPSYFHNAESSDDENNDRIQMFLNIGYQF